MRLLNDLPKQAGIGDGCGILKNNGIALVGEILRHFSEYFGDFGIFTEKFRIGGARACEQGGYLALLPDHPV